MLQIFIFDLLIRIIHVMKKLLTLLYLLVTVATTAQNKQGLVSGPWAGNVELRNATIWVEVTPEVKNVAIKFYAEGGMTQDKMVEYKGEFRQRF